MDSQLYGSCKCLAITALGATTVAGLVAMDGRTQTGSAGVCIASALVLGASLISMAILHSSGRKEPPASQ